MNLKTKGFQKEPNGISREIEIKKLEGSESNSKGIPKNGVSIESQGIRKGTPKELQRCRNTKEEYIKSQGIIMGI